MANPSGGIPPLNPLPQNSNPMNSGLGPMPGSPTNMLPPVGDQNSNNPKTQVNLNLDANKKNEPRSILKALRDIIYGPQYDNKLDNIEKAIDRIHNNLSSKTSSNYLNLMKSIINKSIEKGDLDKEIGKNILNYDLGSRIARYKNAAEIVDSIPYCARALKVLTSEIISPHDVTKNSIQILENKVTNDKIVEEVTTIKTLLKVIDFEDYLFQIVYETLKNGDCFVEVCNYKSDDVPLTQTILSEDGEEIIEDDEEIFGLKVINEKTEEKHEVNLRLQFVMENETQEDIISILEEDEENDEIVDGLLNGKIDVDDISNLKKKEKNFEDIEKKIKKLIKKTTAEDIKILIHNPDKVIKLQSKRFKLCIGYLVLPEFSPGGNQKNSLFGMQTSNIVTGMSSVGNSPSFSFFSGRGMNSFGGIESIYTSIIKKVKKFMDDDDIFVNKKEIMELLKKTISEIDFTDNDEKDTLFKIRFVPVTRMEHFCIPSMKYFPYGESIFEKLSFQAKVLIALETANTVKIITDSIDKRIVYVESGLPRDARNIIEEFKMAFKRRKFSLDGIGTVGTVPSMISSYEDIYIPRNRGRNLVDLETLNTSSSAREITEDLKFIRDTLVAGLEVPPSYLNLEENLSNKSALSFENVMFARNIVFYQQILGKYLRSIINKIYQAVFKRSISPEITIAFNPPRMLQLERDAEKFDLSFRVISQLEQMGINKQWALRNYMDLPWEDIEQHETMEEINNRLKTGMINPETGGMAGGMGSSMPPMGF